METSDFSYSPKISASILPLKNLCPELQIKSIFNAHRAGISSVHFDVLSSRSKTKVVELNSEVTAHIFTPTLLALVNKKANEEGLNIESDVHLMDTPLNLNSLEEWSVAGANIITIHYEAFASSLECAKALMFIKSLNRKAGLAFRPDTNIANILDFVRANHRSIDLVLQCGVLPCFGGQTLDYNILNNIRELKILREVRGYSYKIMVDGGVEPEVSSSKCVMAGADFLVAGSAVFGNGQRDLATIGEAVKLLTSIQPMADTDVVDNISGILSKLRDKKHGKTWVRIESYHGGGKTYFIEHLASKLKELGYKCIIVGLDLSWTDRQERARLKEEAFRRKANGQDHAYFHGLIQEPAPCHWRKGHADSIIEMLSKSDGKVAITGCYQFNEVGDTNGKVTFEVDDNSIILVEGVYASALGKQDWDYKIYIRTDYEASKKRAMVRDEIKVHRSSDETRMLYEDVYEPTYAEYMKIYSPEELSDCVIDSTEVNDQYLPSNPRIVKTKAPTFILECSSEGCKHQIPLARKSVCPRCGKDLMGQIFYDGKFLESIDEKYNTMWRYHRLLPVKEENIISDGEGDTPVIFLPQVSNHLGVNVWAKLEIVNPTGTFKDREASFVLSMSKQFQQTNLVMQSTGNTAVAITHYANVANIPTWSFVPSRCKYKLLIPKSQNCSGRLIAIDGHPIDVKAFAEDFSVCYNFPKISPFYERCEANATLGYEVGEKVLRGELVKHDLLDGGFDYYVQTLSAGMGLIGFHLAMQRLNRWTDGQIKIPKILASEISEFSPIHDAWVAGREQVGEEAATPYFPDKPLFEPTLWTTNISKYYYHLRKMLIESNGLLSKVTPLDVASALKKYEIRKEIEEFGYRLSPTENSAFIGFTGLAKKVENGEIPKGSNIIVMLTGKGLNENLIKKEPDFEVTIGEHGPAHVFQALR